MLVRGQSPPAILALLHEWELCPGRIREFVQELDRQAGVDKGIDHLAEAVIPNVMHSGRAGPTGGIGAGGFDALWLLREEVVSLCPGTVRERRNAGSRGAVALPHRESDHRDS